MKIYHLLPAFLFTIFALKSQNSEFIYTGRTGPTIEKEKISDARFVTDLMPDFSSYLNMQYESLEKLRNLKKMDYPQEYLNPKENYDNILEYLSFDLTAACDGKEHRASNQGKTLSKEQREIIAKADVGTEIRIWMRFKFKENGASVNSDKFEEGYYAVTIVPAMEAKYPGGNGEFSAYMTEHIYAKHADKKTLQQLSQAMVSFVVDENGLISKTRLVRKTNDEKINQLIISSIANMPNWKPAQNSKGEKIKQTFSIPFGGGC